MDHGQFIELIAKQDGDTPQDDRRLLYAGWRAQRTATISANSRTRRPSPLVRKIKSAAVRRSRIPPAMKEHHIIIVDLNEIIARMNFSPENVDVASHIVHVILR